MWTKRLSSPWSWPSYSSLPRWYLDAFKSIHFIFNPAFLLTVILRGEVVQSPGVPFLEAEICDFCKGPVFVSVSVSIFLSCFSTKPWGEHRALLIHSTAGHIWHGISFQLSSLCLRVTSFLTCLPLPIWTGCFLYSKAILFEWLSHISGCAMLESRFPEALSLLP